MVKFIGSDLIANGPDPLTGRTPSETGRFRRSIPDPPWPEPVTD